jgi:hypothetical protein
MAPVWAALPLSTRSCSGPLVRAEVGCHGSVMPRDTIDPPNADQLEAMAALLEASGQYRVLRQIASRPSLSVPPGTQTRLGLLLDLETTGLDRRGTRSSRWQCCPLPMGWMARSIG